MKLSQFKFNYNAPVTLTFALLSLLVLGLGALTQEASNLLLFSVYRSGLADPLSYVRVFTHVLGHANFAHFFGNFSIILLLGPLLEEKYGSKYMLISILTTALITGILQSLLFPGSALLGASGIVFMMMIMSSFTNIKKGFIPLTLILIVLLYLGQEVYQGLFTKDNVSQLTHIVGGISGASMGYWFFRLKPSN